MLLEVLIGLATPLAAEHIGRGDAGARITAVVEKLMEFATRTDSFNFVRARNVFYRTLLDIGGNQELARVLPGMHVHLLRVQFRRFASSIENDSFQDYQAIAQAVLAGDRRRAELAGRRHVRRIASAIESLSDKAFAPSR